MALKTVPNSTINLSSSGILLLLTYAPIASEIVNTDRTIRIGNNHIPKHFFFLQKTFLQAKTFAKNNPFRKSVGEKKKFFRLFIISLVKLSFPKKNLLSNYKPASLLLAELIVVFIL